MTVKVTWKTFTHSKAQHIVIRFRAGAILERVIGRGEVVSEATSAFFGR